MNMRARRARALLGICIFALVAVVIPTGAIAGKPAPKNGGLPTIAGVPADGQTLTANAGAWSTSPTSYTYTWNGCGASCIAIATHTGSSTSDKLTLDPAGAQSGLKITVTVVATNSTGPSTPATSAPTAVVDSPVNTTAPSVTDQQGHSPPVVGDTLSGTTGSWAGVPSPTLSAQWQTCTTTAANSCAGIANATDSTYVLTSGDAGRYIRYAVTGVNLLGTATAQSAATAAVTSTVSTTDPVIAAVGDMACDPLSSAFNGGAGTSTNCHMNQVRTLISSINPVAVLGLGDMQYEDGQYGKYVGGVVNSTSTMPCPNAATTCSVPASYDPAFGLFKSITFPTPGGGHDANGASGYYQYFGTNAGPTQNQTWYSLDVGNWHIVSLNANCPQVPGYSGKNECAAGSAQETWLRNDLAASTKPCSIMFVHYPRWNAGEFADNTNYQPLLQDFYNAGGDLLLVGHDHDYQRYAPQDPNGNLDTARGITEIVVGTGGKNHNPSTYPINTTHPNLLVWNVDTFGVLKLTLHSTSYDFDFLPEPGHTFTDSGRNILCH
jgi:hypothetical protein